MDKRFPISLLISVTLHAAFFSYVSFVIPKLKQGDKEGQNGDGPSRYQGVDAQNIIEKQRPVEVTMIDVDKDPEILIPKKPKKVLKDAEKECPGAWYGGIGIQNGSHPLGERIERIFAGYPADIAGLQVGDVITSVVGGEITGPPGSIVNMTVLRGTQFLQISIIRGKVCYGG